MNYENMLTLKEHLAKHDAGIWLDVATGRGDFLKFALNSFRSYQSIAAIDNDPDTLAQAIKQLKDSPVILLMGSALQMPFNNGYFDTITMSNALHHIENLQQLFAETVRVCRQGGSVIVNEMLNDSNSPIEETYMMYHRLVSDIDHQYGRYHRDTYTLKEMMSLLNNGNFQLVDYFIHAEVSGDNMNKDEIDSISDRLRKKVSMLKGTDYYYFYENKAREVINVFIKNGIRRPRHATFLLKVA